jgi:hypothetical protein
MSDSSLLTPPPRLPPDLADKFVADALRNDINRALLDRLASAGLPDAWLVAGCLFQTVWNGLSGRPPQENIRDYDIFYHDPTDLSWEAEDRAIRRFAALCERIPAKVELRNQARVHLWYEARFGHPYPPLRDSRDGIDRFLVACTSVGLRRTGDGIEVYAPYGLADLYAGRLRPPPANPPPDLFAAKAGSYRARWPWLVVLPSPLRCSSFPPPLAGGAGGGGEPHRNARHLR